MKILIIATTFLISLFSIRTQEIFQPIFLQPQIIEISATLKFNKCNNKAYVPIVLPKDASGWIYSISDVGKREMGAPKSSLLDQVLALADQEASNISDFITHGSARKNFNLYILNGKKEVDGFFNCECYKYIEKHIGTTSRSGFIENNVHDTYYIGIENANDLSNLRLKIEAVAVR